MKSKGSSSTDQSSVQYDEIVVKRRIPSKRSAGNEHQKSYHRLSLGGTSAYAGHLSSFVFGKIKSLWTQQTTASAGLNQLATGTTSLTLSFASMGVFVIGPH